MVFQFLWQVLLRGSMHSQINIWLHHNKGFLPQINFTQLTFSSSNLTPIVLTLTQILIRSVIYCLIEIFMYTPLEHYPIMCPAIFWVDTLPHSMWEESCFWSMTHNPKANRRPVPLWRFLQPSPLPPALSTLLYSALVWWNVPQKPFPCSLTEKTCKQLHFPLEVVRKCFFSFGGGGERGNKENGRQGCRWKPEKSREFKWENMWLLVSCMVPAFLYQQNTALLKHIRIQMLWQTDRHRWTDGWADMRKDM